MIAGSWRRKVGLLSFLIHEGRPGWHNDRVLCCAGSPEVFDCGELVKLAIDAAGASPTAKPDNAFIANMAQVAHACCSSLLFVNIAVIQSGV